MILLDTNVCIRFLEGRSQPLKQRFQAVPAAEKCLCTIVAAELLYGAAKSQRKAQTLAVVLPFIQCFRMFDFDFNAASHFGEIRADLEAIGSPIGLFYLQIAAIARANNLVLVTGNTAEFGRVAGLTVENWEMSA